MSINVTAVKIPGRRAELVLNDDATVQDALNSADLTLDANSEIKVSGDVSNTSRQLKDGDAITISTKVKGN